MEKPFIHTVQLVGFFVHSRNRYIDEYINFFVVVLLLLPMLACFELVSVAAAATTHGVVEQLECVLLHCAWNVIIAMTSIKPLGLSF